MIIGFLGAGIMGAPMARHLAAAGHDVRIWNRTPAKAEGLGATVAGSPAEAVAGADVLVTMLSDGDAVTAALDGVTLGAGQVWWQASTVGLAAIGRLHALAGPAGFVDGPVLGTRQPAEQGQLTVLASGPGRDRLGPVFEPVAAKVLDLGDAVGTGSRMKLVVNHWVLAFVEGLAETIALAERLDIDPAKFIDAIAGGAMDAPYVRLKGQAMIDREYPPSFPLVLAAKDARLIVEAAADLPLPRLLREQLAMAVDAGRGDEDVAAVIEALERG